MAITLEMVLAFLVIVSAIGGVWWRIQSQIAALWKALHEHKLHVAEDYTSLQSLEKTEERLVKAIQQLTARMDALPGEFAKQMNSLMKSRD